MFQEKIEKERFNVNKGREAFIERILNIPNHSTKSYKKEKYRPSDYL